MLNKSVARRYAEAFFAIAQEQQQVDLFQKEISEIAETISAHDELGVYMDHVLIPPKDKKEIISRLFAGKVSEVTLNFVRLVIDKRRANYFGAITEEYKAMADNSRNVLKADFVSARHVDKEDITELEKALSSATGKQVRINLTIDPSLIGGVKVRVGDRVIDASVVKKLEMLKSSLIQAKIS